MASISAYRLNGVTYDDTDLCTKVFGADSGAQEFPVTGIARSRFYLFRSPKQPPEWLAYLRPILTDLPDYEPSDGIGAVLILQPKAAVAITYAVCWGSGYQHLRNDVTQWDLGVRVALNLLSQSADGAKTWDPNRVRAIKSKRIGRTTLTSLIQSSSKSMMQEFPFSPDRDLLRSVTGIPYDEDLWGKTITGGRSVRLPRPAHPTGMIESCARVEKTFVATHYKNHFRWIDNVKPVVNANEIAKVEAAILKAVLEGSSNELQLAPPDLIDPDQVEKFLYRCSRTSSEVAIPDLASAGEFLEKFPSTPTVTYESLKTRYCIDAVDDSGEKIHSWRLADCITGQVSLGKRTYIVDGAQILLVDSDYLSNLDDFVKSLRQFPGSLPKVQPGEKEEYYNQRLKTHLGNAILLDQRLVNRPNATAVEICDVATTTKRLIHVKRGRGSSNLSHLFSQGTVCGELLVTDSDFRHEAGKVIGSAIPSGQKHLKKDFAWITETRPVFGDRSVDYVVLIENSSSLSSTSLPFFSKVNLKQRHSELTRMGFNCTLTLVGQ